MLTESQKEIILTGMRPTGSLHLGHYVGTLENWLKLQKKYDCYFLIADYQALGDHVTEIEKIRYSVVNMVIDWLALGLDPKEAKFVIQSYIPEYAELTVLLSMIVPLSRVQQNPTLKAEMAQIDKKDLSLGFFNYPVSQVADILLQKANLVPVGEDQLPHIELTRDVANKFNRLYGEIFPIPIALVGRVPRLVGIDGKTKMSKSLGNCIYLSDSREVVEEKVKKMYTDPKRKRITDPGHIEGNVVFTYLDVFYSDVEELQGLKFQYQNGKIGDVQTKKILADSLNKFLDPIRERRKYYENHPEEIKSALTEGTLRAKKVAEKTIAEVKSVMNINKYENLLDNIRRDD